MVAFNPEEGVHVVVECKRLYSAEKCTEMLNDLERLRTFVPREPGLGTQSFGILAATTWDRAIAEWWSTLDGQPPGTHDSWKSLMKGLEKAHRGSVLLNTYDESIAVGDHRTHHFLYAVFEPS